MLKIGEILKMFEILFKCFGSQKGKTQAGEEYKGKNKSKRGLTSPQEDQRIKVKVKRGVDAGMGA